MKSILSGLRSIGGGLAEVLAPDYCMLCGGRLSKAEHRICALCRIKLPATDFHRIPGNAMQQRFAGYGTIENAGAVFYYVRSTPLATAIHDFKYNKFPSLAVEFGREMARRLLTTGFFYGIDLLMPVPIHFTKRMRRGYNQSERICRGLTEMSGIPTADNLYARRPHKTQTGRTPEGRRANTRGVFSVRRPDELLDRHVLIVDDVCTTGATLLACAEALHSAVPGIRCSVLTLAATTTT